MSEPQGSTYRSQFGVQTTGATSPRTLAWLVAASISRAVMTPPRPAARPDAYLREDAVATSAA
jgi:hypothetical protein